MELDKYIKRLESERDKFKQYFQEVSESSARQAKAILNLKKEILALSKKLKEYRGTIKTLTNMGESKAHFLDFEQRISELETAWKLATDQTELCSLQSRISALEQSEEVE